MVLIQNRQCRDIINVSISLLTFNDTLCYFIENRPNFAPTLCCKLPQKLICSAFTQGLTAENMLLTMKNNFNLLCLSFSTLWFIAQRKKILNKWYKSFLLLYQNLMKNIFLAVQTKIYTSYQHIELQVNHANVCNYYVWLFKYSLKFILA